MTNDQIRLRNGLLSLGIVGLAVGILFLVKDPDRAWQLSLAITGSIATLWVRSGRTPAPDLPQAVPLAEDLYRAYVAVYPVGTPRTLDGAHPDVRHGWLAVAEHVVQRIAERRLPPVPDLPRPSTPAAVGTIGALCLVPLCSCGALGASLGAAAIDCSVPALAGQIGGLLVRVQEILRGGDPDWAAQLDQLALGGREALACAVGRVASQPGRPAGTGPAGAEDEAPRLAAQYLASRRLAVRP